MASAESFWRDRPTFVTGATGLVGGWLVRRLLDLRADVVCLVRDWVPQCELIRAGLLESVKVVRGDTRDQPLLERALGEFEIDTVIHLAAQTIVGIANRDDLDVASQARNTRRINNLHTYLTIERRSQLLLASNDLRHDETGLLATSCNASIRGWAQSSAVRTGYALFRRREADPSVRARVTSLVCLGGESRDCTTSFRQGCTMEVNAEIDGKERIAVQPIERTTKLMTPSKSGGLLYA